MGVHVHQPQGSATRKEQEATVCLLDGPVVRRGSSLISIPDASQRVFAYVALREGRVDRRAVAGILWPECPESRASGNLRTALWRLRASDADLMTTDGHWLTLTPHTRVDVTSLRRWAGRLISGRHERDDLTLTRLDACLAELLPGWYEDWVLFERERLRQRTLHALQLLSARLSEERRHAEAVEAAMSAVGLEPLRDSAQRALISAHLAEGNVAEARRALDRYAALLASELGVQPSREILALLD